MTKAMPWKYFYYKFDLDTNLSLRESQSLGELSFTSDGDISAVVEFFLKFESLVVTVHDTVLILSASFAWKGEKLFQLNHLKVLFNVTNRNQLIWM